MIGIIILFIALGLGCGLWGEFAEQRRLKRMTRDCKTERGRYERNRA